MTNYNAIRTDLSTSEMEVFQRIVPKDGLLVEIGTGTGGTAVLLRRLSNGRIVTIDPHIPYLPQQYFDQLKIEYIHGTSALASTFIDDGSVDFLFVDGGHDFESIWTDVCLWQPKLSPQAQVIFDDFTTDGRGGASNLAVKICLDALLDRGVITQIERHNKLLIADVNRQPSSDVLSECIASYMRLSPADGTERSKLEDLSRRILESKWHIVHAEDAQSIAGRRWMQVYENLDLVRQYLPAPACVRSLSAQIAVRQAQLDIARISLMGK